MIRELWALYEREVKKTYRNVAVVFIMVVQPIMWLVFFGNSLSGSPSSFLQGFFRTSNYVAFLLPGQLSTTMLFTGMFGSMSIIQDKRFGYMKRLLVTKAPREAIFLSKVLGSTTRGLIQAPIMIAVGLAFGVTIPFNPLGIFEWILGLIMLGIGISSLYSIITMKSADWQTPNVVANMVNLPLMFSSTSIFPSTLFPWWMKGLSEVNPLTYSSNIGRAVVLGSQFNPMNLVFLLVFCLVMLTGGFLACRKWLTAE